MKRLGFLSGVGVALALAVVGGAAFAGLKLLVAPATALAVVLTLLAGGYLAYLLHNAEARTGKVVTAAAWGLASAALVALTAHPGLVLGLQVLALWLVRSLYYHSSLLRSLVDLALNALALGAAVWAAEQSGSLFLSAWCFFLVQALFAFFPADLQRGAKTPVLNDPFIQAHRTAEAALRELANQR